MTRVGRIALAGTMFACTAATTGCDRILGIQEKRPSDAGPDEPGLEISVAAPRVRIVRGQSATVDVSIQRVGGFSGAVSVALTGQPNGVTLDPVSLAPSQSTATLTLRASSSADRGSAILQIYGLSEAVSAKSQSLQLIVQDASGSQDLTFGASGGAPGRVLVALGIGGQGVGPGGLKLAPQTGAIVLCGHARTLTADSSVALARLNADGTPDLLNFGNAGVALGNSAASSADACNAMFLRAGGGINLAGLATPAGAGTRDLMVGRYTPAGNPDMNTGIGGFATTHIDSGDSVANGLLPSDSDGYIAGGGGPRGAVFARYQKYGALDPGFGVDGVATVGPEGTAALWLASQSSGNIVAAIASATFRIVRLTPAGKLDTTFASQGVADVGDMGSSAAVVLVAPQPKDAIIAVGTTTGAGGSQDVAIVRLTESGQVDPSYGSAGWGFAHFGSATSKSSVSAAVLQDDGAVVIAGQTPTDLGDAFSVVRFSADGSPDTGFGPDGRRIFDVPGSAQAIALDDLGRIVVAGVAGAGDTPAGVVVYRLWP